MNMFSFLLLLTSFSIFPVHFLHLDVNGAQFGGQVLELEFCWQYRDAQLSSLSSIPTLHLF